MLKTRNVPVQCLSIQNYDSDIPGIIRIIQKEVASLDGHRIAWNLGGGQKPHQIAAWEVFRNRTDHGHADDFVCYANQDNSGLLEKWHNDNGQLKRDTEDICVDLSAEEIFTVFGYDVEQDGQLLYRKNQLYYKNNLSDLLPYREFREYLLKLPQLEQFESSNEITPESIFREFAQKKNMARVAYPIVKKTAEQLIYSMENNFSNAPEQVLKSPKALKGLTNTVLGGETTPALIAAFKEICSLKAAARSPIAVTSPQLKKIIGTDSITIDSTLLRKISKENKAAMYFENIVIERAATHIQKYKTNITEAHANLKIRKDGLVKAEYDVLCVTNKGTIVALDAKTFDFANKDIDARIYNLEQGSGYYRNFAAVFPFDFSDINSSYFPAALKNLPFQLKRRGLDFYVINDSDPDTTFYITNDGKGNLDIHMSPVPNSVECKPMSRFFQNSQVKAR